MFFRGFVSRSPALLSKFFTTYIRPIIDYNSAIWNPSSKYLIDLIENIQRRFSKRIHSLSNFSYFERLSILNLEPLELRRLKCDLNMYYKIIHGFTSIDCNSVFTFKPPTRSSRSASHRFCIAKPINYLQATMNSFYYRAIDAWNSLSSDLVESNTVFSFRSKLNTVDLSRYLHGSCFN